MFNKLGGRKAVGAALVILAAIGVDLLSTNGLSSNLLYMLMAAFGCFTAGNMGEHWTNATSDTAVAKVLEVEAIKQLENDRLELAKSLEGVRANAEQTTQSLLKIFNAGQAVSQNHFQDVKEALVVSQKTLNHLAGLPPNE